MRAVAQRCTTAPTTLSRLTDSLSNIEASSDKSARLGSSDVPLSGEDQSPCESVWIFREPRPTKEKVLDPTNHQSRSAPYHPRTQANMRGATIVASDSIIYLGVSSDSLPQVIFSFGTAPE